MTDHRRLLQEIDACRPGSNDLDDAELALLAECLAQKGPGHELYDRLQRLDLKIAEAMDEVPVPAGLADRLLNRLAASAAGSAAVHETARPVPDEAASEEAISESDPASPAELPARRTRRYWLAGSMALAAAAGLAGLAVLLEGYWLRESPETPASLIEQGLAFYRNEQPGPGQPLAQGLPRGFPPSNRILPFPGTTWRPISDFVQPGVQGVAYDFRAAGTEATLYVVRIPAAGLPPMPPLRSTPLTAGFVGSAWREGELTYVLVVQGNDRTYRSFLKPQTLT